MRPNTRPQDKPLWTRVDALQRRIKDRSPRANVRASLRVMRAALPR